MSNHWSPSRRDVLFLGIAGVIAAVPLSRRRPLALVRRNVLVMGTIAEFAVVHEDPRQAHAAIDAAVAELRRVDNTMSRFKTASDVGRANHSAWRTAVPVGAATMTVLQESIRWAADTAGAFDPCLGRATQLWDVGHRVEPPPADQSRPLARRHLYRQLELDRHRGYPVVRFHDRDVSLDLGGIAKGYAVDEAVTSLRRHGVRHALVGAGGDLYALGRGPSGAPWHIGVESPDRRSAPAASLRLADAAIATSGDYQQYFEHRGRRYHHLLDPETAMPRVSPHRSISVVAPTCMAADAGATVAYVMGATEAARVLAGHGAQVAHTIG
jgi:thiamine biosynthesis lipoprotein